MPQFFILVEYINIRDKKIIWFRIDRKGKTSSSRTC